MSAPVLRQLSTGEVLDVSFGFYRAHFVPLVTIAAITRVVPDSLGIYLEQSGGLLANLTLGIVQIVISVVLSFVAVAATTSVVSEAYLGRSLPATEALRSAGGVIGSLLVVSLGSMLLIGFGIMLLIVPGIIAMAGLALSSVIVVLERLPGVAAMQRSWDLTKGYRRKVLAVLGITMLLLIIPALLIGLIVGVLTIGNSESLGIAPAVGTFIFGLFIFPFMYVAMVVLYYDLRVRKEGFDLELLAADAPAT